jgi:hypothetical protein
MILFFVDFEEEVIIKQMKELISFNFNAQESSMKPSSTQSCSPSPTPSKRRKKRLAHLQSSQERRTRLQRKEMRVRH